MSAKRYAVFVRNNAFFLNSSFSSLFFCYVIQFSEIYYFVIAPACSVTFKPNRRTIVFMDNATCASTQTYKFANLFNQFIRRFNPSFRNYYHTPVNCTFAGVIFTPGFKRMWFLYSHFLSN